ncbi:MAG: hypothetical protein CMI74_08150 [Candidatus Pelagibacter sp.]|nr:hypothetical protein [Candidatus Pelagibacter sp.]|tara:strand:+ start:5487 stop:5924 length:438 start_codon:yes stop_codon:yes gene_type:complete
MIKIKKYANRRLYNTETSTYITQEDIVNLITNNEEFKIINANSNEDITSLVLTQIILDRETRGSKIIPEELLKKLIINHKQNKTNDTYTFLKNITDFANASRLFDNNPNSEIKFNPFDFKEYFNSKVDKDRYKKTNKSKDLIKSN